MPPLETQYLSLPAPDVEVGPSAYSVKAHGQSVRLNLSDAGVYSVDTLAVDLPEVTTADYDEAVRLSVELCRRLAIQAALWRDLQTLRSAPLGSEGVLADA